MRRSPRTHWRTGLPWALRGLGKSSTTWPRKYLYLHLQIKIVPKSTAFRVHRLQQIRISLLCLGTRSMWEGGLSLSRDGVLMVTSKIRMTHSVQPSLYIITTIEVRHQYQQQQLCNYDSIIKPITLLISERFPLKPIIRGSFLTDKSQANLYQSQKTGTMRACLTVLPLMKS